MPSNLPISLIQCRNGSSHTPHFNLVSSHSDINKPGQCPYPFWIGSVYLDLFNLPVKWLCIFPVSCTFSYDHGTCQRSDKLSMGSIMIMVLHDLDGKHDNDFIILHVTLLLNSLSIFSLALF